MHAKDALRWVMCATRPLKLGEWSELVRLCSRDIPVSAKASYLEKICHNLIAVDRESGTIRFVHLSVREFLNQQSDFDIIPPDVMAARGCLQHLVKTEKADRLLPYVIENWPIHCRQAIETSESTDVLTLALDFFRDKEAHKRWLSRVVTDDLDSHSTVNPLFTIARYGIPGTCPVILRHPHEFRVNKAHRNSKKRTPLHLAVKFGHSKVLQELLGCEEGFGDVNVQDEDGRTPFALAVFLKTIEITRLLISNENVDVNIPDSLALGQFPPLVRATWHENIAMVEVLLQACKPRLDVDGVNVKGEAALHWAVRRSRPDIVHMLLESGVNVNIQNSALEVPLSIVTSVLTDPLTRKDTDRNIFSMLCSHPNVNFHVRDADWYDIPCSFLWRWIGPERGGYGDQLSVGDFSAMFGEIIASRNCNANAPGNIDGDNPLQLSALYGFVDATHLLLERPDIDVNVISQYQLGRTALHIAISGNTIPTGCDKVAEALIACESVDLRATDNYGMTPLAFAVKMGKWQLVELLLQREGVGDEDVLKNIEYNTEFVEACRIPNNHQAALAVLGVEDQRATQLMPSIPERQRRHQLVEEVVAASLLVNPAEAKEKLQQMDVNITTTADETALIRFVWAEYSSDDRRRGFRALLDIDGIQVNTIDCFNKTALDYAVLNNKDIELVNMLLARPELRIENTGSINNFIARPGQRPILLQPIFLGAKDTVEALAKDSRVDVNAVDQLGHSICFWAITHWWSTTPAGGMFMALLNSNRLDINYKCKSNGETPIFTASRCNSTMIVGILLDHPDFTTLDEPDNNWNTPLGIATKEGYADVVEMLLKKGPNLHWRNYQGLTSLDIAIEQGNANIVELLSGAMG